MIRIYLPMYRFPPMTAGCVLSEWSTLSGSKPPTVWSRNDKKKMAPLFFFFFFLFRLTYCFLSSCHGLAVCTCSTYIHTYEHMHGYPFTCTGFSTRLRVIQSLPIFPVAWMATVRASFLPSFLPESTYYMCITAQPDKVNPPPQTISCT